MKWICRLRDKHVWGEEMYIPPSAPMYMSRACKLCERLEFSYDLGETWTTEYRNDVSWKDELENEMRMEEYGRHL